MPTSGGGYTFARRAMGPWGGFLTGTAILYGVGRSTAVNQALFNDNEQYEGVSTVAFGVGSAVNRYLLEQLAEIGRGHAEGDLGGDGPGTVVAGHPCEHGALAPPAARAPARFVAVVNPLTCDDGAHRGAKAGSGVLT